MNHIHAPKSALFVCLGNICRSPSAEAVMQHLAEKSGLNVLFDSAGTANYHTGEPPDSRAIKVGQRLGFELQNLRARQVAVDDFYAFDVIFAMDKSNFANLQKLQDEAKQSANGRALAQLQLFDPSGQAVADPYYGDESDFVAMFAHLQAVAQQHIDAWQA